MMDTDTNALAMQLTTHDRGKIRPEPQMSGVAIQLKRSEHPRQMKV